MSWKTYELELTTPALISGADQQAGEIRVPSIRGQVRWWFRAMGGSPDEEKRGFGGVHGEVQASAVRFRLAGCPASGGAVNLNDFVNAGDMNHPVSYLLWPLRPTRNSQQTRGFVPPASRFTLQVRVDPALPKPLGNRCLGAVHLWMLLGSLGTRSRRGLGGIALTEDLADFPWEAGDLEQWTSAVYEETLHFERSPELQVLQLGPPAPEWIQALSAAGKWLKEFRAGSTRSVRNPRRWGKNDHDVGIGRPGDKMVYRPALGLPLMQRYSGGDRVESRYRGGDRWASPVHLKVVRLQSLYLPLAIFFPWMAIPEGEDIELRKGPRQSRVMLSHGLLQEMMRPAVGTGFPRRLLP